MQRPVLCLEVLIPSGVHGYNMKHVVADLVVTEAANLEEARDAEQGVKDIVPGSLMDAASRRLEHLHKEAGHVLICEHFTPGHLCGVK